MLSNISFSESILHSDKRGNEVLGRIALNIAFLDAIELFPFTFSKLEGFFVTEEEFQTYTENNEYEIDSLSPVTKEGNLIPELVSRVEEDIEISVRAKNVILRASLDKVELSYRDLNSSIKEKFPNCGEKTESEIRLLIESIASSTKKQKQSSEILETNVIPFLYNMLSTKQCMCSVRTKNIIIRANENNIEITGKDLKQSFKYKLENCGTKSENEIRELVKKNKILIPDKAKNKGLFKLTIYTFLQASLFQERQDISCLFWAYPKDLTLLDLLDELYSEISNESNDVSLLKLNVLVESLLYKEQVNVSDFNLFTLDDFEGAFEKCFKCEASNPDVEKQFLEYLGHAQISSNTLETINIIYDKAVELLSNVDSEGSSKFRLLFSPPTFKNEKALNIFVNRHFSNRKVTLEELGESHNLTRERIRQIDKQSLVRFLNDSMALCWVIVDMYLLKNLSNLKHELALNSGVVKVDKCHELFIFCPSWLQGLLSLKGNYENYISKVADKFKDGYYLTNFFNDNLQKVFDKDDWFENVRDNLSLTFTSRQVLLDEAPFLSNDALDFFLKNRNILKKEKSIEEVCACIVNFHGYPMRMEDIYSKYKEQVFNPRDVRTLTNIIMDSDQFLIMDRGTYGTYQILPVACNRVKEIRNLSYEYLIENPDKKFVTSTEIIELLPTFDGLEKLSKYAIYGILQDDPRFFCHRYGHKVGLTENFGQKDLIAFGDILKNSLIEKGPLSVRQMQIEANKYGDYHDQTIVTELARSRNIIRINRGLYGLMGEHLDIEKLIIAELISLIYLEKKSRTTLFILEKIKKYSNSIQQETLIDYLKKNSDEVDVTDDFLKLNKKLDIQTWITNTVSNFKEIDDLKEQLLVVQKNIESEEIILDNSNDLNSSVIMTELGFDDF